MKIYAKLSLGIGIVVLAMMGVVVFLIAQALTISGYKDFSADAGVLLQKWDAVELASYDFQFSVDPLADVAADWQVAVDDFSGSLETLVSDRRVDALGGSVREQVDNTTGLWEFTSKNLVTVDTTLSVRPRSGFGGRLSM